MIAGFFILVLLFCVAWLAWPPPESAQPDDGHDEHEDAGVG